MRSSVYRLISKHYLRRVIPIHSWVAIFIGPTITHQLDLFFFRHIQKEVHVQMVDTVQQELRRCKVCLVS